MAGHRRRAYGVEVHVGELLLHRSSLTQAIATSRCHPSTVLVVAQWHLDIKLSSMDNGNAIVEHDIVAAQIFRDDCQAMPDPTSFSIDRNHPSLMTWASSC